MAPMAAALAPQARAVPAESFLATIQAAARACGVTRLADITGLDRIGFPVWQAVRPAGRAFNLAAGSIARSTRPRVERIARSTASRQALEYMSVFGITARL